MQVQLPLRQVVASQCQSQIYTLYKKLYRFLNFSQLLHIGNESIFSDPVSCGRDYNTCKRSETLIYRSFPLAAYFQTNERRTNSMTECTQDSERWAGPIVCNMVRQGTKQTGDADSGLDVTGDANR